MIKVWKFKGNRYLDLEKYGIHELVKIDLQTWNALASKYEVQNNIARFHATLKINKISVSVDELYVDLGAGVPHIQVKKVIATALAKHANVTVI